MDNLKELFNRHGLRCTTQRVEIYTALAACRCHPTAEELHELVRPEVPGLSLATVYNTLESLVRCGMCRKIPNSRGGVRFDADNRDHVHLALEDGRVLDVPDRVGRLVSESLPENLPAIIEREMGVRVGSISVEIVVHEDNGQRTHRSQSQD